MRKTYVDRLIYHLSPCEQAQTWSALYNDPARAWAECRRGDWMAWLLGHRADGDSRRRLVRALLAYRKGYVALPADPNVRRCHALADGWAFGRVAVPELRRHRLTVTYSPGVRMVDWRAADAAAELAEDAAGSSLFFRSAGNAALHFANAAAGNAWPYGQNALPDEALADCAGVIRRFFPEPPLDLGRDE